MQRCSLSRPAALLVTGLVATLGTGAETTPRAIHERIEKVKQSEPTGWKKIPWTASLLEARRLSRAESHPVFLFTHDGNIETGRC